MCRACSTNEGEEESIEYWWGKPEGKGALGRPRCKLVDNLIWILKDIELDGVDWIDLA
jgi:hypothetical protein